MEDCKLENCQFTSTHPKCRQCFPVRGLCKTCGHSHDFQPGDVERGDLYLRDSDPWQWPCPRCGAREMGRFDRRVEIPQKQTTLEGLFG